MSCAGCKHLGAKLYGHYRCHRLPEGLKRGSAVKYVLLEYHSPPGKPCPDFETNG